MKTSDHARMALLQEWLRASASGDRVYAGLSWRIYVANASYPTGSVTAYIKHADGNVAPVQTISGSCEPKSASKAFVTHGSCRANAHGHAERMLLRRKLER